MYLYLLGAEATVPDVTVPVPDVTAQVSPNSIYDLIG